MNRKWLLLALFAGLAGVLAVVAFRKGEARPMCGDWPVNFAHRGASARAPENTMEAFRAGIEDGAQGLEMDVHMTRDGEIVVIHDDTVDRTTDGSGLVREMTLKEIQALDAGYHFGSYRGRGVRIPTLAEVYEEFPQACVNLEIKESQSGVESAVFEVIRQAGAERRTLVASFRHDVIRRFREVSGGEVATSASRKEVRTFFMMSRLRL
ncbi:MAG: glycerophosphodiester phosphodiesterase family protein, partial [Actinomycetota bacterium]